MTPPEVLDDVYKQLRPLVLELSKYNLSIDGPIEMGFETAIVTFKFK